MKALSLKSIYSIENSYDALGNVSERSQQWATDSTGNPANSFIELFSYDGLNRLATASVTGYATQVFQYDSIGNIESKTGVGNGNYAYPASGATSFGTYGASNNRPHAVQSIPGIGSFTYDDNGNLKNGAGRDIDWTSFDMPVKITKGNESSTFAYGADHQRTKQIKTDGGANSSTIYYAGAMEVETKGDSVESIKTYWPGGIGFETDKPNQATELNWIHTDRLGSVIAISNAGGILVERLAYDSWGKRRSLSGNETPDSIDGVKDNKGFTGHEMLDKLDLVHMNGRIYDPLIARFMSADPIIQDPEHSQSYNRYTYVWNNPTNLTDPTGFASIDSSSQSQQNTSGGETNEQTVVIRGNRLCPDGWICIKDPFQMLEIPGSNEHAASGTKDNQGKGEKKATFATNSVMTGVNDKQLLSQKPCSTPSVECSKSNAERAEAYGRWQEKSSGAVESVCVECYVIGTGSLFKAGYLSARGLFVTEEVVAAKLAIGATGKVGEDALKLMGGESQVFFQTSKGSRYVDQLVGNAAHESKVGYTALTTSISRQISKDVELIQTKQINSSTWHFFTSPVTGLGGPTKPLLNTLQQNGINVIIH